MDNKTEITKWNYEMNLIWLIELKAERLNWLGLMSFCEFL